MDGYLSKPIQAAELGRALTELASKPAGPAEAEPTAEDPAAVYDEGAALARLDGDHDLLREVAAVFLSDSPRLVQSIRTAVSGGDARGLQLSAHALKGAASTFSARALVEAAWALEQMGRNADLHGAADAATVLEKETGRLQQALAPYAASSDPAPA